MKLELPDDIKALSDEQVIEILDTQPITQVNSALWYLTRRIRDLVRQAGVLVTPAGKKLMIGTDKFSWREDELISQFPGVGEHVVTVKCSTVQKAEMVVGYALESGFTPEEVSHSIEPKLALVNKMIKTLPKDQVALLLDMRTPNGRIEEVN